MIDNIALVLKSDLPPMPKLLMVCLADNSDQYGTCFPSVSHLSRKTSMSERTVQRYLGWLTEKGYIERYWDFTRNNPNRRLRHYRLVLSGIPTRPQPDYSHCPPALREELIARFEWTCGYCARMGDDANGPDGRPWAVDRIVPGSRGGSYDPYNVTLACFSCNSRKRTKLPSPAPQSLGTVLDSAEPEDSRGANLAPPPSSRGVPAEDDRGAKPGNSGVPTLAPEPSEEPSEEPSVQEPAKLALPKPERRKSKTQLARERFFARRGAEAHPDEGRKPDTRKAPTAVEDAAAPHPAEDRTAASPKVIHELYKEARRIFKGRTGHVLGTLSQKGGEQWVEAYEKHGGDVLIRAFEVWVEAEKRFIGKMDYPIARFLKAVDEWAQDATTPVAPDDDPNAGLALTEQGRRMYEKYAGKAP